MKQEEKKLLKNSALLIIGNFSSKILVFLLVPFYTSVLSTEQYGISDLLVTTVNLVYPILTLMISTAVLRFSLDKAGNSKQILSIGFWIQLAGFVLLTTVSLLFFRKTSYAEYLWYFVAYYGTFTVYTLLLQYAKGMEKVAIYALASVINTFILISCNLVFLLKLHLAIQGYIMSMIIAYGSTALIVFFGSGAWRDITTPGKIDKAIVKSMVHYSVPLMPNSISWWVSNSSDRYIMKIYRGADELGIYSVAYKIPSILSTVTSILLSAWEISAVDEFGTEKSRKFFSQMYKHYFEILTVLCVLIMMLVKPLASVLFQKDFYSAWLFVPALLFASVFNTMSAFLGTIFTAAKKTNSIFTTTMLGAVTNIVLNFALIPTFGAQGAAIATAIGYIATYVARMIGSQKIMKLEINYTEGIIKMVLLAGMAIATCIDTRISLLAGIIILFIERKYIYDLIRIVWQKTKNVVSRKLH